jgi:hypothetical protein
MELTQLLILRNIQPGNIMQLAVQTFHMMKLVENRTQHALVMTCA